MQFELKFGSVSWINRDPNPIWLAGKAVVLNPSWVPKTYVGLAATANSRPPTQLNDFQSWQDTKQFRSLAYGHIGVIVDDQTGAVTKVQAINQITNPGWTPPFSALSFWKDSATYPSALVGSAFDGWTALKGAWSFSYHAGEQSPLSSVVVGARHPNTTLAGIGAGESVLANAVIKFRAGAITDNLGIVAVGCPFHVPWVWCETLITFVGGKVRAYGRGSIFPTHCWYLDGALASTAPQVSDSSFPKKKLFAVPGIARQNPAINAIANINDPFEIDVQRLALYPVLSAGAPASGAQTGLSGEAVLGGPVSGHPNAAPAGATTNLR